MRHFRWVALLVLGLITSQADAQRPSSQVLATLAVNSGSFDRIDTPVSAPIGVLALNTPSRELALFEITDGQDTPTPSQLISGSSTRLVWILSGHTPPGQTRAFELRSISRRHGVDNAGGIRTTDDGEAIHVNADGKPVLSYRYELQPAPPDVDKVFERGGFIHPLRTPSGEVLTRIQPPDHWHHYGIWNPWTRTVHEGREVDFWNLGSRQGTVRPRVVMETTSGAVAGGFRAVLDHVDFTSGNEKTAMNEQWELTVWSPEGAHMIDFVSTLTAASTEPITLSAYRYQGFSIRATEKWGDDTSRLLTSEGLNKSTGNAERARWIDANGVSGVGRSGLLMMGHPGNRDYPERLRIWPTGMNGGVENVFINFNPAQEHDWVIEPGHPEQLRYRLIAYDGEMTADVAERHWNDWASPPTVDMRPASLEGRRVLVYTRNGEGFVHDNIAASVAALKAMGSEQGFVVESSDDPTLFQPDSLRKFDAIIFSNSNNEAFETDAQREAFQSYVRQGGGFAGIHSASGSERTWPWFSALLGGNFQRHAPRQDFVAEVVDPAHPATAGLPRRWSIADDECYFLRELNPALKVLLAADLTTVEDPSRDDYPGVIFADRFPIAWYQTFDGGRQFYTSLGHRIEHYSDPMMMAHILGGLRWVINGDG